jgi:hypothetical protein
LRWENRDEQRKNDKNERRKKKKKKSDFIFFLVRLLARGQTWLGKKVDVLVGRTQKCFKNETHLALDGTDDSSTVDYSRDLTHGKEKKIAVN